MAQDGYNKILERSMTSNINYDDLKVNDKRDEDQFFARGGENIKNIDDLRSYIDMKARQQEASRSP